MGSENIKVEAMLVSYGEDTAQVQKIVISPALTKAAISGKGFILYAPSGAKHLFWVNGTGSDTAPAVSDATAHECDCELSTTIAECATVIKTAIDAVVATFDATISGLEITVTNVDDGYAPQAHDCKVTDKGIGFGYQLITQGEVAADLGLMDGDIEVAFEESFIDVNAHSEGTTPVAQLKTGVSSVEITMSALETTKAKLKAMFVKTNGSFTPDGGTEVFGMGTYKNFENMMKFASKLTLHPKRLNAGDKSEDITFHKAIPNLSGMTFSGEEVFTLPLSFKVFPASGVDSRVNYYSIGDGSQSLV